MLPTRGHTRFRQLLLGSVTAAVLHDALTPLWTEAHSGNDDPPRGLARKAVLCAIDMGPQTPCVLAAAAFSTHFGVPLFVAHSIPPLDPSFPSGPATRAHQLAVEEALERHHAHCAQAGVDTPLEIVKHAGLVSGFSTQCRRTPRIC